MINCWNTACSLDDIVLKQALEERLWGLLYSVNDIVLKQALEERVWNLLCLNKIALEKAQQI